MSTFWTDADRTAAALETMKRATANSIKYNAVRNGERTWTNETTALLKKLCYGDNMLSARQISIEVGKSRSAVIGKAHRMGWSLPINHGQKPGLGLLKGINKRSKKERKKEPQRFDGVSDNPEPLALHTPREVPKCKYPNTCDKEIVARSYCADHYILTRADKEAARATIEHLTGKA